MATNGFLELPITQRDVRQQPDSEHVHAERGDLPVLGRSVRLRRFERVRTELVGAAPNRRFVIEWRNVHFCCISPESMDAEVVLHENGRILTQYRNLDSSREEGDSATIGIENESGTVALQYSFNEASVSNGLAVLYRLPPSGFVEGRGDRRQRQPRRWRVPRSRQRGLGLPRDHDRQQRQLPHAVAARHLHDRGVRLELRKPVRRGRARPGGRGRNAELALRTARAVVSPNALEFIVT